MSWYLMEALIGVFLMTLGWIGYQQCTRRLRLIEEESGNDSKVD